ncbi:CBL-interacting protein kinase 19 [Platanthera guangdongensis]|uniref:CBL-interacting protein kinase 19 n=1 Tax=Platanthera guangdongensis TaxID=2320717 RepID=A0ABR2LZE9_9ASPA
MAGQGRPSSGDLAVVGFRKGRPRPPDPRRPHRDRFHEGSAKVARSRAASSRPALAGSGQGCPDPGGLAAASLCEGCPRPPASGRPLRGRPPLLATLGVEGRWPVARTGVVKPPFFTGWPSHYLGDSGFDLSRFFEERAEETRFISGEPVPTIISKLEVIAKLWKWLIVSGDVGDAECGRFPMFVAAKAMKTAEGSTPEFVDGLNNHAASRHCKAQHQTEPTKKNR